MEKRSNKRHNCEAAISCSYFNEKEARAARVLNCSESGAYLECDGFFKSGSTVLIRMQQFVSGASGTEIYCSPRIVSLGEVKWCRQMTSRDPSCFAIGIKYLGAMAY